MAELRKDYILDRYVIIATERAKRPDQFKGEIPSKKVPMCYFCPGNENTTPPETGRVRLDMQDMKGWTIRYFPNKFAAVGQEGNPALRTDNAFFTFSDAIGYHEVIVETPNHEEELSDLSVSHISEVLKIYKARILALSGMPGIKYVTVFKNSGEKAGTSIVHTHSQVIAYNLIPKIIQEKEESVRKSGICPYCRIIDIEKGSYRRCFENNGFISFTPYASRFPMEIWVFPKRHVLNITEFKDSEYTDLAEILKKILSKLKEINAPYNFYLQYGLRDMHFHIEITPRIANWAGFEMATETIINSVTPEDAAKFYRGEK